MSLSTGELAQLRLSAESYLPDTATIQTVSLASDGMGGMTPTWSNTYTGVACRLAPLSSKDEAMVGDQPAATTRWVLTLHHDQAIAEKNRVVHASETYEVVGMADIVMPDIRREV